MFLLNFLTFFREEKMRALWQSGGNINGTTIVFEDISELEQSLLLNRLFFISQHVGTILNDD